jgi:hypothetical protein
VIYKRSIEEILDDCVTAIHEQGRTVAECLDRYPAHRSELESLLHLSLRLQHARTLQAPPDFRRLSTIRTGNLFAARRVRRPEGRFPLLSRVRRSALAAAALASVVVIITLLIGGGLAYASADDLPGEALYPVKRAVESARLTLARGDANDAKLHLTFAARRLDEATALVEKGRPGDVGQNLADYDAEMASVTAFIAKETDPRSPERSALARQVLTVQT